MDAADKVSNEGSTVDLARIDFTLLILISLAGSPKHGYAIMRDVNELTRNNPKLVPGSLYLKLAKLTESELIKVSGKGAGQTGNETTEYALTERGRELLRQNLLRLMSLAQTGQIRLENSQS